MILTTETVICISAGVAAIVSLICSGFCQRIHTCRQNDKHMILSHRIATLERRVLFPAIEAEVLDVDAPAPTPALPVYTVSASASPQLPQINIPMGAVSPRMMAI